MAELQGWHCPLTTLRPPLPSFAATASSLSPSTSSPCLLHMCCCHVLHLSLAAPQSLWQRAHSCCIPSSAQEAASIAAFWAGQRFALPAKSSCLGSHAQGIYTCFVLELCCFQCIFRQFTGFLRRWPKVPSGMSSATAKLCFTPLCFGFPNLSVFCRIFLL